MSRLKDLLEGDRHDRNYLLDWMVNFMEDNSLTSKFEDYLEDIELKDVEDALHLDESKGGCCCQCGSESHICNNRNCPEDIE